MRRVAVIGHGPSPHNRGWGLFIDNCDVVVRMFDCAWQCREDYGSRYDIGVVTMAQRQLQWFTTEATRKPKEWWLYHPDGCRFNLTTIAKQTEMDVHGDTAFALACGAKTLGADFALTRGTAAACESLRRFPECELILVGFDEIVSGKLSQNTYPPDCVKWIEKRPDRGETLTEIREGHKTLGHDISVEMSTIEAAAKRHGCLIKHALDIW